MTGLVDALWSSEIDFIRERGRVAICRKPADGEHSTGAMSG